MGRMKTAHQSAKYIRKYERTLEAMDEKELLSLAVEAFDAINKSTGITYWSEADGVAKAIVAFSQVVKDRGLAGLIDAASECGMGHLGWSTWMTDAKKLVLAKIP
jgi:hypothetical protein